MQSAKVWHQIVGKVRKSHFRRPTRSCIPAIEQLSQPSASHCSKVYSCWVLHLVLTCQNEPVFQRLGRIKFYMASHVLLHTINIFSDLTNCLSSYRNRRALALRSVAANMSSTRWPGLKHLCAVLYQHDAPLLWLHHGRLMILWQKVFMRSFIHWRLRNVCNSVCECQGVHLHSAAQNSTLTVCTVKMDGAQSGRSE